MRDDGTATPRRDAGFAAGTARRVAGLALLAGAMALGAGGPAWAQAQPATASAPAAKAPPGLSAQAGAALAAQRNCLGCHHAVQRRTGPTFQAIAKRYNAIPDAKAREAAIEGLARKVRQGGKGAWGVVPMPANNQVSEADARQLVGWILDHHR